jgi:type III secretion protein J
MLAPPAKFLPRSARFLAVLAMTLLCACKLELNSKLDEQEANEMMAKLMASGVSVSKTMGKEGVTLMVEESQFAQAVDVLASHGLPRRTFSTTSEMFADQGMVASPLQEWARFNYAKAQELSQSISTIPGVVKADVHIASSRKQSAFETVSPPSASVLIQMQEDMITPGLVPEIKQLVSFSIPDIEYDRVGVIVSPVQREEKHAEMVSMAGILVHPGSVQKFQTGLLSVGIGGTLIVVLICVLAFLSWRRSRKGVAAQ